ncbi:MAG: dihydrofolate reductase [Planctomycetota bacterium]
MRISLVVAHTRNRVIGRDGDMPWRLSNDLKNFKRLTLDHSILMGRKTFKSIGRPLPKRQNIVLTRNAEYSQPGITVVHTWDEALNAARSSQEYKTDELFIVGGAQIYAIALPHADRIYLTEIQAELDGDTFFPEIASEEWQEISREEHAASEKNDYDHSFVTLERLPASNS